MKKRKMDAEAAENENEDWEDINLAIDNSLDEEPALRRSPRDKTTPAKKAANSAKFKSPGKKRHKISATKYVAPQDNKENQAEQMIVSEEKARVPLQNLTSTLNASSVNATIANTEVPKPAAPTNTQLLWLQQASQQMMPNNNSVASTSFPMFPQMSVQAPNYNGVLPGSQQSVPTSYQTNMFGFPQAQPMQPMMVHPQGYFGTQTMSHTPIMQPMGPMQIIQRSIQSFEQSLADADTNALKHRVQELEKQNVRLQLDNLKNVCGMFPGSQFMYR